MDGAQLRMEPQMRLLAAALLTTIAMTGCDKKEIIVRCDNFGIESGYFKGSRKNSHEEGRGSTVFALRKSTSWKSTERIPAALDGDMGYYWGDSDGNELIMGFEHQRYSSSYPYTATTLTINRTTGKGEFRKHHHVSRDETPKFTIFYLRNCRPAKKAF
jgi:hypothetical protein